MIPLHTPVIYDGRPAKVVGRTFEESPKYDVQFSGERVIIANVGADELKTQETSKP